MVEVGQIISDKYKLLRLLGDGGMGSVFEAEHLQLGTHVAIKVLHAELARRSGIAERFVQEARVSAQIRSPHVVQVSDVDKTSDGVAYLVMELLQGEPLAGVVRRERKLPVGTACEYASQILQGLEAAHALGVIHRDLKPDNVFVTFSGGKPVLKLIDFGIAKLKTAQTGETKNLTVAGMLMGTPEYMAPEQAYSADKVDVRADLYAVGVMLYEMLSGKPPAEADDPRVLILKIERGEVTPLVQAAPGIEPPLAGLVHRAMAPRPELRFANATEMRIALEDILTGKRPATARLAASPAAPALNAVNAAALADTAQAGKDLGTGTVMGAPAESVLQGGTGRPPPMASGGTVSGPPIPAASLLPHAPVPGVHPVPHHGPAPYPAPAPSHAHAHAKKKGGLGLIIALATIALLLGAGAVVAYVVGTQGPNPTTPVVDLPTMTATPTTTTPATPTTAATVVPVTPVTPLTTSTVPVPTPTGATTSTAKKDAGAPTPGKTDAGPAPAPADAGSGQTTIVTPFGTFQFPGPRPVFYPPDQPWPPPTIAPIPAPP